MNQTTSQELESMAADLALLRRRLARSESARSQAEDLLEEKSRYLAQANDELNRHKDLLAQQLSRRTKQLLDAQRVAGFGTMIWDIEAGRGELSPHAQAMLGLTGSLELGSIVPVARRVIDEDRHDAIVWAKAIVAKALAESRSEDCGGCPGRRKRPQDLTPAAVDCASCPDLADCEISMMVRIAGATADAANRMVRVMAQSQFDEAMGHSLIFLTIQDVTREVEAANEAESLRKRDQLRLAELEDLTAELRKAQAQAVAANLAKTRFLAMMSHDIRTPMNGVLGMLELFEDRGLTEAQLNTLAHVKASGEQLRVLLDDIIDLERAEAGKLKLNRQPVEVASLLMTSVGFWAKAAQDKGLEFALVRNAFDWPEPPPRWVNADRFRLRQLVDNLLSNAIKYTQTGGITVRVGSIATDRMRFEVIDTGIGVPPERQQELFEDFGQLHRDNLEAGGSGLGLAICKRLVDLKGGQIGVCTAPDGKGSMFWVELPYRKVDDPDQQSGRDVQILRLADGARPRILVAEDVETNRIVAQGLLRKLGCDVELVVNGEQAVEAVAKSTFDLVLMDMSMPCMEGPEATRRIRSLDGPASEIPILALTAYSRPEELAPMIEAGAQGTINKPIVLEDLYAAIKAICCQPRITGGQ